MLATVITRMLAVIPAGHRVEVLWLATEEPSLLSSTRTLREIAEPRIVDLETQVEYGVAEHHVEVSSLVAEPTGPTPLEVRPDLRVVRTLRGTVRRCVVTTVAGTEGSYVRTTLVIEPHGSSVPAR